MTLLGSDWNNRVRERYVFLRVTTRRTGVGIDPLAAQAVNQGFTFNALKAKTGMPRQSQIRMAGIKDVGDSGNQKIPQLGQIDGFFSQFLQG